MPEPAAESPKSDLLCVGCGYDLCGLAPDGACPECGTSIARSIGGDALTAADPAWLRRVWRGLLLVGIGCILLIARVPAWVLIELAAEDWLAAHPIVFTVLTIADQLAVNLLILAGIVGVTALDPRQTDAEPSIGLRRVARAGAIAALVFLPIHEGLKLGAGGAAAVLASVSAWLLVALLVVAIVAATYHLAKLVERARDTALAKRLRKHGRTFAVLLPIAVAGDALRPAVGLVSPYVDGLILTMAGCGGLLAFFAAVGLMVGWWQARAGLRLWIAVAEETAAAGEASPAPGSSTGPLPRRQ